MEAHYLELTMHRFLLLILLSFCCYSPAQADWQLLYQNDSQGAVLAGDKQRLFAAIRNGLPIRLVWKASRTGQPERFVEHAIEPEFITNASDQEVFAQTPEHIAQTSYWDTEFQDFGTAAVVWRGLLSTSGRFMAVWYNRATGQIIRKAPQRTTISWYADVND